MNEIIADLHRHREQLARACDYDAKKLMEHYRRREKVRADSEPSLNAPAPASTAEANALTLREVPPHQ